MCQLEGKSPMRQLNSGRNLKW